MKKIIALIIVAIITGVVIAARSQADIGIGISPAYQNPVAQLVGNNAGTSTTFTLTGDSVGTDSTKAYPIDDYTATWIQTLSCVADSTYFRVIRYGAIWASQYGGIAYMSCPIDTISVSSASQSANTPVVLDTGGIPYTLLWYKVIPDTNAVGNQIRIWHMVDGPR